MKYNIIKEHFGSIEEMINTIESRPENPIMSGARKSEFGTKGFTGTSSYEEAKELFRNGYAEILPQIKKGVAADMKRTEVKPRRRIETNVIGYAPHVPNAILGLPNSMIYTRQIPQKTKVLSLVIGITENCGTHASEFIKSGVAALGVVNTLELDGYRVNLKVAFWCARCLDDIAFATVNVKNYCEHLDLQKLCFPLAHPSMFRRLGFKWLETVSGLKGNWSFGYGSQIKELSFIENHFLNDNEYFINLAVTKKNNYDVQKIIEYIGIEK